ncbi:hypothetical protein HS125_08375 [bacterium]|nr:hypothetical protein [bacterium]
MPTTSARGLFQITETCQRHRRGDGRALEVDNDATTAVGGDITTNTTWADTTQAYLITSTVVVKEGVKLTIAPGVTVRHENNGFSAFSLEGDLEAQAGATLLMRTRAYWSESLRRHAIVVKEGAQASFAGANVLTTETDSYSTEGVDRWAAAVRAEEGSQIVVSGALFQSMNTNSNWRTGYGVYIDQTFASFTNVPVENRFRGFRVAVFQHAADVQQVIQPLAMIQCERNHMFSGTIVRDMTIQNHDVQLYGDVTVEVTATLTLAPGSELETGEGERLYVKGAIVGTDAQVTARSRAYWNLNDRRHVIYLINNGRGEFQRCRFETTETNGYATDGDSSYWAAVLYAEAGAQLTVRGCTFVSTNSINSWRVGYGIRLEGATAEVSDDGAIRNSFTGFRAGIYQFFSGASQEIAVCDFSDCEWNVWINGDVIRNQTLRNSSTHAVGSFTVGATSTLTLAPGSQLYKSEGVRITVRGRVEADSAHYVPRTRAYWNETSRQHGLYFVEGGGGSFDDCTLTCTEVDGYANDGNTSYWAAALYGDATAELSIRGCTFESTNTVNNYRTGYGVRVEGGAITLGDLAGAMTRMTGFRCGIPQQFGSRPQEISLFQQNDLQIGMYLVGDLVSDATLVNRNLRMIGNLTVGPGATLTMTPGSDLYVPGYSLTFLVQGALVARDATLTLETRAHWQDSTRRHGLWVRNGGRCDLEDCRLVATEYDGYANDNNSDYWAGAIYADNTATLLVRACRFISTRATNNYPVGYGIRLEGATAEIAGGGVPSSMQGFRTGVLQVFSSNQQNIETLALADTPWGVRIRGTLSGDLTLRNGNMLVDRDLTITGNTTLSVAPDSYLYTNGYLITVDPGSGFSIASSTMEIWRHVRNRGVVSATDTKFIVRTYAHPNANDRFFGFDLRNSSQSTFRNCSFYTTETRTTGDNNDWSALFYLADTARLALYGCYATNAPSGAGHYTRFVVRSFSQGALTLQDSIFTQNYIALQVDAVPGQTLVKNNDFHGNTWAIINNTQPDFVARENWWGSPTGPTHIENPGGSGDRVSDRVDYGQSSLEQPETLLSVHNPLVGQEHSNLIASGTQLGVELMGVRFEPFSSNIAQVAFRLTNRSGVEWADIRNYRLMVDANGNGTIDPGETVRVGGSWLGGQDAGTFIVRFAGAFVSHADATPAYILVADFHNMEAGDTVTVNVDGAQTQAGEPGVGVSVLTTPVTHVAGAQVFVIDRLGGQVPDALNGYGRQNNVALCAFRLTGTQQSIKVLEFTLTNLVGLSRGNFIAASLYLDANGDGVLDAGDTRIGGATEISISGSTGKIVFGSAFNTGGSYLLTANLRGLEAGDHMVVNLTGDKIQTDAVVPVYGAVTPAVHDVDMPYSLALSEVWNKPTHFGQQIDQARYPLMGMRLLPLSRTVNGITLRLSGIVGIGTSEMVNARIYWDKNDNGVLDAADEPVSSTGVVSMAGNTGSVLFAAPFIVRGNYIIAADMRTLANGDEITVSMDSSDVIVPEGYVVTGAIPGIRYVVQQGVADSRTRNQRWTLTFRSPGGTSVNGRFNNAGDKVILGYDTGSAWIYDSQANVPLLMLKDHYDRVEYAGFSSDDSAAITVTRDGAVYVWDLATGSQRSSLFSDLLVTSAVPSPDFSKLMVITEGKGILLDIDNEQRLWEYVPGQATVNAIAYSPNGEYVLIGSSDKRAYLLDAATGVEVRRFIGHTQPVTAVAFTGDGSTLMTSSTDAVVQLWATDNGQPLGGPPITTISLQGQSSQGAAVSRDGSRVAMVTGSGGSAQMRMFAANGLELFAVNIDQKSGGNWTGSLDSLSFDAQGTRVLITSGNNPWGRNASFRVDNGDYLVSWGPQGRFWGNQDGRPRMSRTGDRIFMMTDWGLNVVSTTMEKPILRSPNIPGDRGFDVSADGGKVAWFTAGGNLRVDAVADSGFSTLLDRAVGANNHNAVTMSPGGDMVIDGDRLFSAHTGDLLANYALPDREARSAFSPDASRWGFAIPQDKSLITLRTNDPNAVLQNLMQTDPYTPYKMFYFPDNKRIAAVDGGTGVQAYDMTTDLPVGLYRYPSNSDAALSEDGTLLLLGGTNHVRLIETRTGRILRYFYPQHSSIQTVGVYGAVRRP